MLLTRASVPPGPHAAPFLDESPVNLLYQTKSERRNRISGTGCADVQNAAGKI
jgi:hypothetical protein